MAIQLFNTMSRSLEELQPIKQDTVTLYTCGPTVYDYAHIGNWATYIRWDILVRTLRQSGYAVDWVMNITDVGHLANDGDDGEDKLEKGARREGKTAWEVAKFYEDDFRLGMAALNITLPSRIVKATDTIPDQIEFVKKLESKGFTYRIDDGIYFDTSKLSDYGKLARLDIEGLQAGARIEMNDQKRHITDFAIWKLTPPGAKRDMEWDSPWGKGFPGWHLECSVMAMKYLGETLDIHAGGFDHLAVHHPNEIAQSQAVTGKPLANIWLHSNFITIDGTKLSKSLGNSFTLHDITSKGFDPLDLRMLFLQSHYRTQADFSWEGLAAAKRRFQDLRAMAALRWQAVRSTQLDQTIFARAKESILSALQDDLNLSAALAELSRVEHALHVHGISEEQLDLLSEFVLFIDNLFGFNLRAVVDLAAEQKEAIAKREAARRNKDFATSDHLRDQLHSQGIGLRDTAHGPVWFQL